MQLAIIQACTALWKIQIEQMVVILNFRQRMQRKVNIYVCIQPIFKSWSANDQCIQYIKIKFEIMGSAKLSTFFTSPNYKSFLKDLFIIWDICLSWFKNGSDTNMSKITFLFILWLKFKMTTISSIFISQGGVKSLIKANCFEFWHISL